MTHAPETDRRAHPRLRTHLKAELLVGEMLFECEVVDMSDTGARVELDDDIRENALKLLSIGSEVSLIIPDFYNNDEPDHKEHLHAHVVGISHDEPRLQFELNPRIHHSWKIL